MRKAITTKLRKDTRMTAKKNENETGVGDLNAEPLVKLVRQFEKCLFTGLENIVQAGKTYVQAIDTYPNAARVFSAKFPMLNEEVWRRLELVGRNKMHYLLLIDSSPAADRLRTLTYEDQQKAMNDGLDVLAKDGSSVRVAANRLTPDMAEQVIVKGHIRNLAGQKAFLEDRKPKTSVSISDPTIPMEVVGTRLVIYPRRTKLTLNAARLEAYLTQMRRSEQT
jgi:hypothetical protein